MVAGGGGESLQVGFPSGGFLNRFGRETSENRPSKSRQINGNRNSTVGTRPDVRSLNHNGDTHVLE